MIFPMKQNIGRPNEQRRHHTRILVGQEMAMQDGLAGIILVLNPYSRAAIRWNDDCVPPNVLVKVHDFCECGICFRAQLGTHFLDLESIDVDVELWIEDSCVVLRCS